MSMLTWLFRFVASEAWRNEFGTNDLAAEFEYTERAEVFKFYPQFYHKTDKVGRLFCQ